MNDKPENFGKPIVLPAETIIEKTPELKEYVAEVINKLREQFDGKSYDEKDWMRHAYAWKIYVDDLKAKYEDHFDTKDLSEDKKGQARNLLIVQRSDNKEMLDQVWTVRQEAIKSALSGDYDPYEYTREPQEAVGDFVERADSEFFSGSLPGPAIVWLDKDDVESVKAFRKRYSDRVIMIGSDNTIVPIDNNLAGAIFVSGIAKNKVENKGFPFGFHGKEEVLQEYINAFGTEEILVILAQVCFCNTNRDKIVNPSIGPSTNPPNSRTKGGN